MSSTADMYALPDPENLKRICKAIAVLDAIISQEWQYRYYSYNSKWDKDEECLQMRNGSSDAMFVLFKRGMCCMNGFAHEYEQADKQKLTQGLPAVFNDFMFGEPVTSTGTTFCLWWLSGYRGWENGQIENFDDASGEMLAIFNGNPETYIEWANDYYEEGFAEGGIDAGTVDRIYNGDTLTKKMVLSIVETLDDWDQLKKDLREIDFPFKFGWF